MFVSAGLNSFPLRLVTGLVGVFSPVFLPFLQPYVREGIPGPFQTGCASLVGTNHVMLCVNSVTGSCPVYNPMTLNMVALSISEEGTEARAETGA